ncbi:hypothetical protein B9Z55_013241 [Caenorhabditis nigoni]|uniref:Tyrosine-protein phosphatase domain-containing protein n=1 Tax=Caenorhabditis nigoni TaxID=1611254 RepID=A0A2G5U0U7_9PELO|nr:hypothetical protein B9Z55_013241 [Caenorhabditis nigoni]
MHRRRGVTRGNNNTQDDGTSRKLSKKPSEEKVDNDKEKTTKRAGGVLRKIGFLLHPDKQDNGSTLKRKKKKGTERKRSRHQMVWNPDKKVHFNIDKAHPTIPLKDGEPITDIQKKVFLKFATEAVKKSPPEYSVEFLKQVKPYPGQPLERKIFDSNPTKNRYKDVICNDVTRVILNDGYDNDYIHANYVNGLNTPFILTQGPTTATVADFWRMIVHTKTAYIVMLCEVVEDGKAKCAHYFPEKVGEARTYGPWTVLCSLEDASDAHIVKRTLSVKNGDNGKEHILKHLHTKSWPDRSVPQSTMCLLRMLYIIRTAPGPITVHCSAGIGRTGTFVAIEACLQILTDGKELDLLATCKALRNSRAGSIQVDIQYMTLVQVLLNYGKDNGYWEDSDLDDVSFGRVELLTWNIEQFIQTRGKVDHILATPSTPALNVAPQPPAPLVPVVPPKEPTPHCSPAHKAAECVEKICDKILKPIRSKEKDQHEHKDHSKDVKEQKSPKEHKEEPKLHPLPTTPSKSSTEEGEDAEMQPTQKLDTIKLDTVKKEDDVTTGKLGPSPKAALLGNTSKDSTASKDSKDSGTDLNPKVSRELALEMHGSEKKKGGGSKEGFKLKRKTSDNRSQYFI